MEEKQFIEKCLHPPACTRIERVYIAAIIWATLLYSVAGSEYEIRGTIHQTISDRNRARVETASNFTVFVRDCAWLIQTIQEDENGNISRHEVGCTNGLEIVEYVVNLANAAPEPIEPQTKPKPLRSRNLQGVNSAYIFSNNIPVGFLDKAIEGHLWLMFASQCYWPTLRSNQLTPVFDWRASALSNPALKVKAEWELLNGPGSLPREVKYFGQFNDMNGHYKITGTNSAGATLVPTGFIFDELPLYPPGSTSVRKKVIVEVTSVTNKCSRNILLPIPEGRTFAVDLRLTDPLPGHLATYRQPEGESWIPVEKARKLASANSRGRGVRHSSPALLAVISGLLVAPLFFYFPWKRWRNRSRS